MDNNKKDFKPYIPADKVVPEFTVTALLIGILLAIVFGAANAYLGLLVGMTVSASIPAAVISMGIIRVILRKDSILENNMVQTIGSAGESVAAGARRKDCFPKHPFHRSDCPVWWNTRSMLHGTASSGSYR